MFIGVRVTSDPCLSEEEERRCAGGAEEAVRVVQSRRRPMLESVSTFKSEMTSVVSVVGQW